MKTATRLIFFALAIVLRASSAFSATLVVAANGVDCTSTGAAVYTTIGGAVTAASAGDTVLVCPGIYDEQVVVNKALTLQAAVSTAPLIAPTTVSANTTNLANGAPIAAIVLVDRARPVTINGFAVDGSGGAFTTCSPRYMGVFFRASAGMLQNTSVTNVQDTCTAVNFLHASGVFVQSGNMGPGLNSDVVIDSVTTHHYGLRGITCNEPGTNCSIMNSTVTGLGEEALSVQTGIQIGFGARSKIVGNTVTNNSHAPGSSFVGCGLAYFSAGGGLGFASTNTLSGNDKDVCTAGLGPP